MGHSNRSSWPLWVRIGLWGVPNRMAAWGFVWFCVAVAVGGVAYGFVDPRYFGVGAMVLAALWYGLSIRWVDRHGSWS